MAVSGKGSIGRAWDYKSRSAAEQAAMNNCSGACKVITSFHNGCGAVVHNSTTHRYSGGHGETRGKAQRSAMNRAGGGRYVTSVCTSN
ncbi:DUF4189 domain-containing protein [Streptomyces triticagri]|uniref:DUF4189 domain-containing protein n=1 Tax=Streptomyces triticagri TaxID=2293568 RepID=A0A372LZ78_9ACTN|nr:DUF4189 domain-containing protein [Streptomyces triticagri]